MTTYKSSELSEKKITLDSDKCSCSLTTMGKRKAFCFALLSCRAHPPVLYRNSTTKHPQKNINYLLLKHLSHDLCNPLHPALHLTSTFRMDSDQGTNVSLQLNSHFLHLKTHRPPFTAVLHIHKIWYIGLGLRSIHPAPAIQDDLRSGFLQKRKRE